MQLEIKGNGSNNIVRLLFMVQTDTLQYQCGAKYLSGLSVGIYGNNDTGPTPSRGNAWFDYGGQAAVDHTLRQVYELLDTVNWVKQFGSKPFYLMTDEVACWRNNADRSCVDLDAVRKKTAFVMADFVNYLIYKKIGIVTRGLVTTNPVHAGEEGSVIVSWTWAPNPKDVLSAATAVYGPAPEKKHSRDLLNKTELFLRQQEAAANGYSVQAIS